MFSFRRKPKKEPQPKQIKPSPSLPELSSTGIPWPEDLVDIAAIHQSPVSEEYQASLPGHGAPKTPSLQASEHGPIPFHKPFRTIGSGDAGQAGAISSIYMNSGSTPQFEPKTPKATTLQKGTPKYSQRRARVPPTFNLMVTGAKGTGKTSLLRLLLETAEVSPTATPDQKIALEGFLKGSTKSTQTIQAACVEISESRFDRILFSVIDTPGLDFQEGRELKLERQVNAVIKYIDQQYADTMSEESKVVRQNKGDQHIHLCIYLVDPASIMTQGERRALSSYPLATRSEVTVSQSPGSSQDADAASEEEPSDSDERLTMSPTELRIIRRIAAKANVLPVIARADSLTDEKLDAVKDAIRAGMSEAGIDLGVFAPATPTAEEPSTPKRKTRTKFTAPKDNDSADTPAGVNGDTAEDTHSEADAADDEDNERTPRPVIKLRPKRHGRDLSRSRSRRDLSSLAEDQDVPLSPRANGFDSVANVRFSAHVVASVDMSTLIPFALIAPDVSRRRLESKSPCSSAGHASPSSDDAPSPSVASFEPHGRGSNYLERPPGDMKGVFVRSYRWGTIDVLDPNHCDFAAMRTAVLSTHLKLLKIRTKEVLYEKYRTDKLLARRATAQISEEQRQRLLEDMGL
ncbi:Septin-domain-containing protein [Coprinopsis sp. MPI-PUGE-AT-0042]|nr:Septin-domain-containing protein [Coprinopsis sp. MPI-PUGE-AT-0042]